MSAFATILLYKPVNSIAPQGIHKEDARRIREDKRRTRGGQEEDKRRTRGEQEEDKRKIRGRHKKDTRMTE